MRKICLVASAIMTIAIVINYAHERRIAYENIRFSIERKVVMAHMMMLSDLYGRIGQVLAEHGDAPLGYIRKPMFANEPHLVVDYINPVYCKVTRVENEINGVKISTCEILIEDSRDEK